MAEIEEVLVPRGAEVQTVGVLYELQSRYTLKDWPDESLVEDIATARAMVDAGPPAEFAWPERPIVAVAAAAICAYATDGPVRGVGPGVGHRGVLLGAEPPWSTTWPGPPL